MFTVLRGQPGLPASELMLVEPPNQPLSAMTTTHTQSGVKQAVPFFWVRDMDQSIRFYVDGLAERAVPTHRQFDNTILLSA